MFPTRWSSVALLAAYMGFFGAALVSWREVNGVTVGGSTLWALVGLLGVATIASFLHGRA